MFLVIALCFSFIFSSSQVFVACEGNFYQGNGSLWTIADEDVFEYSGNPVGEVLQSVLVHENMLFATVNVSSNIQVFNISDDDLELMYTIDTEGSGPREMVVFGGHLYFSNWYTSDIKRLNLNTWLIDQEIDMPGLPEDIVELNGKLYISITMENDWTDGSEVVVLDPVSNEIANIYNVGFGPGEMAVHDGEVVVARTYYDENWNAFYGTSKIKNDGDVIVASYGAGVACGGSVHSYNGELYRAFDGGIALLDDDLNIMDDTRLGDFNPSEVYSVKTIGDYIYFGLTDFAAPDQVFVLDSNGDVVNDYTVGALPGDFAAWNSCVASGDINNDSVLNIVDIVDAVNNILNQNEFICEADLNGDGRLDVADVVHMVQMVLGIDSFRGAANWLMHHFPDLKVNEKLKKIAQSNKMK